MAETKIHYRLKIILWRFARGVISTKVSIEQFPNIADVSCPLCNLVVENDLHIMACCNFT